MAEDPDVKYVFCGDAYPAEWSCGGKVGPELAAKLAKLTEGEKTVVRILPGTEEFSGDILTEDEFEEWALKTIGYNRSSSGGTQEQVEAYLKAKNDLCYDPMERACRALMEKYSDWKALQPADGASYPRIDRANGLFAELTREEAAALAADPAVRSLE